MRKVDSPLPLPWSAVVCGHSRTGCGSRMIAVASRRISAVYVAEKAMT